MFIRPHARLRHRGLCTLAAAGLALTACGGSSDSSANDSVGTVAASTSDTEPSGDATAATDTATNPPPDTAVPAGDAEASDSGASGATYDPGDAEFRAVNLLDRPVDIYVRTTGLVEAFPIQAGLAAGAVSEFVAPPEGGSFVVTEADAGDPTCVSTCDHFVTILTASFPDQGPTFTAVLYDDEFSGARALDLWELPEPGREGTSNAMPPADPTTALGVFTAVAVTGADFGLRLGVDGVDGCVEPVGGGSILIGGNQTLAFALESEASFTLHDQPDQDCSAAPVGGPFEYAGSPGGRDHIILSGSPGSLDVIVLPMVEGASVAPPADEDQREVAVGLIAGELTDEFGLDGAAATCAAELVVDAIAIDVLLVDGQLVDLDLLGDEIAALAGAALVESVDSCGIDPSVYGG